MKFIEIKSFCVTARIHHFKKKGTGLEFILFPMIHIGEKGFYEEIRSRIEVCDVIFAEGVNSKLAGFLTFPYRVAAKSKRINLITQQSAQLLKNLKSKILNSDMSPREFNRKLNEFTLPTKLFLLLACPVFGIYLFFSGSREMLVKYLLLEKPDLKKDDAEDEIDKFEKLFIDERDGVLIENIEQFHNENDNEKLKVAVVFGAAHMPKVASFLIHELKYKLVETKLVKIFDRKPQ